MMDMNRIGTRVKRLLQLVTHNWALKLLALAVLFAKVGSKLCRKFLVLGGKKFRYLIC